MRLASTEKLKKLVAIPFARRKESLIDLNTRLKSYTMLFSRNGPLLNDAKFGKRIYGDLLNRIVDNFEDKGDYLCEISGLRFQTTFEICDSTPNRRCAFPSIAEPSRQVHYG